MNFGFGSHKKGNKKEYTKNTKNKENEEENKENIDDKEQDVHSETSPVTRVVTYEGELRKGFLLEGMAPSIIRAFGGNTGLIEGVYYGLTVLTVWASVVLAFGYFPAFLGDSRLYKYLVIGIVFALFLFSKQLAKILEYHKDTLCRNCGMSAACEEFKQPIVKKETGPEGLKITLTFYWKCRLCGYEDTRTYHSAYQTKEGHGTAKSRALSAGDEKKNL